MPIIKVLRSLFVVVLICKVLQHHHYIHTSLFIYKCIYVRFEKPPRKDLRVRDVLAQRTASTRDASLVQSNFHVYVTFPFFFSSFFFFFHC